MAAVPGTRAKLFEWILRHCNRWRAGRRHIAAQGRRRHSPRAAVAGGCAAAQAATRPLSPSLAAMSLVYRKGRGSARMSQRGSWKRNTCRRVLLQERVIRERSAEEGIGCAGEGEGEGGCCGAGGSAESGRGRSGSGWFQPCADQRTRWQRGLEHCKINGGRGAKTSPRIERGTDGLEARAGASAGG